MKAFFQFNKYLLIQKLSNYPGYHMTLVIYANDILH